MRWKSSVGRSPSLATNRYYMLTTSEWQGRYREVVSEGQFFAPAKPAFPPSLAVKPLAKLRADEQEHHTRRRLKASWHKTTKPSDLPATVNEAVTQGKFMLLSGEICLTSDR
ncbi:MAG: hypothetical protein QS721_00335 [Candidatus Endonucleobacter sp. (ex Gigantidas childressi)]|nr:hypothetical protein [Candidatus Endonucleobacter sp. (ex Gigantidas childressi)]